MPPRPTRPMNSPCPIHSGQGEPSVEIASPRPIISAPQITVQRVPTRSAMRLITMPPVPEPSQASALASAGIERVPPISPAMSLSATAMIQAAPNAIIITRSATEATTQESLVSSEDDDCSMNLYPGAECLQIAAGLTIARNSGQPRGTHGPKARFDRAAARRPDRSEADEFQPRPACSDEMMARVTGLSAQTSARRQGLERSRAK